MTPGLLGQTFVHFYLHRNRTCRFGGSTIGGHYPLVCGCAYRSNCPQDKFPFTAKYDICFELGRWEIIRTTDCLIQRISTGQSRFEMATQLHYLRTSRRHFRNGHSGHTIHNYIITYVYINLSRRLAKLPSQMLPMHFWRQKIMFTAGNPEVGAVWSRFQCPGRSSRYTNCALEFQRGDWVWSSGEVKLQRNPWDIFFFLRDGYCVTYQCQLFGE